MKNITAADPGSHSADLVAQNLEQLKALFPEAFAEGKVNFDVLKQLLGGAIDEREEKYGLSWHGKRRARQLALTPSTGTLCPCPEKSVEWDTTQNLMIEGDNLEVLKLLQKSYAGKIRLIYIDPPYNTGGDFIYPDNFRDGIKNYLELSGQTEDGKKIASNSETSGRFHTDWLNMMYPRLRLAKTLLRRDGFIFISIDHNEVGNLRAMCAEIFGEENFRNMIVVRRGVKNVQAQFDSISNLSSGHEYVVCYSANADIRLPLLSHDVGEAQAGKWDTFWRGTDRHTLRYELFGETPETGQWRWSKDRAFRAAENYKKFLSDQGNQLSLDDYYLEHHQSTNEELDFVRLNEEGVVQYYVPPRDYKLISDNWMDVSIKGSETEFDTEKHLNLLLRIVKWIAAPDDIVLDFFAGSGTTGHAVMELNRQDGGKRRYFLVQFPEPMAGGRFQKLSDLTSDRLKTAAERIRVGLSEGKLDLGFRAFSLNSSNIREWNALDEDLAKALESSIDHLKHNRSEYDVLYELLLKLGLDLCVPLQARKIANMTIYAIGGGVLMACLSDKIPLEAIEKLATEMMEWHASLATAGEVTCVFRDSAFDSDVSKTNLVAILEQGGIKNIRSI